MSGYTEFRWYDYLIFGGTLAISLAIGIYYALTGDKQRTTKEYLLGNRKMKTFPVAISIYVSHISAILILGSTAEFYNFGVTNWFQALGSAVAHIISSFCFVPLFYKLGYTSAFMYLEARYGKTICKLIGSIFLVIGSAMYMGLAMYSPAIALEGVTGIPTWVSLITTGVVVTVYSTIGGMKAVIGTDTFQGVVMAGGVILVLILGAIKVGGLTTAWETASAAGRLDVVWAPKPFVRMSFFSAFIGKIYGEIGAVGLAQSSVQRIISTPSIKQARDVLLWNIPIMLAMYTIVYLCGMVVFTYYHLSGCDPLRSGQITNSNQLLPFFIMDGLGIPGLPGLFVAVLFCGALSSVSSSLNSVTAVVWTDFLEWKFHYLKESRKATINKIIAFLFGLVGIGFAFAFAYVEGNVLQISNTIFGSLNGPITGIFLMGMFLPWTEWRGAIFGMVVGFTVSVTISLGNSINYPWGKTLPTDVSNCHALNLTITKDNGSNKEDVFELFKMAYGWYYTVAIMLTIIFGSMFSWLFHRQDPSTVNPDHMVPVFDRLFKCLPASWRRKLHCGVKYDDSQNLEKQESTIQISTVSSIGAPEIVGNEKSTRM